MEKLVHTLTGDLLFKLFFVRFQGYLKRFIAAALGLNASELRETEVTNPDILPDTLGKKYCRMDLNVKANDMVINIEMQRKSSSVYPTRSLFYWAKNYSQALNEGKGYETLPETIAINILEEPLFDGPKYHSEYHILEKVEHTRLTDRLCLHFFELSKLPELTADANELLLWLHLFNAKTDEDLSQISKIGGSFMAEVVEAYKSLTASDELKELERMMEKAAHDEASARYQDHMNMAKKMKAEGMDAITIAKITDLPAEDILKL